MKTNFGLSDDARQAVGQMLNTLLADEYVLYTTTRDYHWNVTGPCFFSLHEQFEKQYGQIAVWIDELAERARAIDVSARGNWAELVNTARISAFPGAGLPAAQMLAQLLTLHNHIIFHLLAGNETCTANHFDVGTADFLVSLLARHEKTAWMLQAQLATAV